MRYSYLLASSFLTLLAACSGNDVKDTLGLNRDAPDEYRVVTRPPLSVPPAFDLIPPAEAGEVPAAQATNKQAQSILTGKPIEQTNTFTLSPGKTPAAAVKSEIPAAKTSPEASFLQKAGVKEADPNVRAELERDKLAVALPPEEERSWYDPTGWWSTAKKEPVVDAKGEADRIKQNKAEGKPVNEGEVPENSQRDTGILGKILGY